MEQTLRSRQSPLLGGGVDEAGDGVEEHWFLQQERVVTFVAVDRNGRPVPVPPLKPETAEEIRRYNAAKERRERRIQERDSEERSKS